MDARLSPVRTLILGLAVLVSFLALGYSASLLFLVLSRPAPVPPPSLSLPEENAVAGQAGLAADWPPLFGTPGSAPPPAAPEAPAPVTTSWRLKGLFSAGDAGWAILSDGSKDELVRPGDRLADAAVVAAIGRDSVTLRVGETEITLGFERAALSPGSEGAAGGSDHPGGAAGTAAEPATTNEQAAAAALPETSVSLSLPLDDPRDLRRLLALAGGLSQTDIDGTSALEVVFVRPEQLYDKAGLRQGDVILRINGIAAGDNEALLANAADLLRAGSFRLEIIRNGQKQAISITVGSGD